MVLEGLSLEEALHTFERNMNLTIHIENAIETEGRYKDKVCWDDGIEHLLRLMNLLTDFGYEIHNDVVYIYIREVV